MRGLNLETDPRALPKKEFPQFRALTYRSEVIVPRPGPVAYTPAAGSLEEWLLGKVGTATFVKVPVGTESWVAYADFADRVPRLRDEAGAEVPLSVPGPSVAPTVSSVWPGDAVPFGESKVYAAAWATTGHDYETGLSPVLEVTNDYMNLTFTTGNGATSPPAGTVLTATGDKSVTVVRVTTQAGSWAGGDASGILFVRAVAGQVVAGNAFSGSGYSFTSSAAPEAVPIDVYLNGPAEAAPSGFNLWVAYAADSAGYYHDVGRNDPAAIVSDVWPEDRLLTLPTYPGPLDLDYAPEPLVVPSTADGFAVHKRCLFLWDGAVLRYSEGDNPRTYRENATLNMDTDVLAAVSRGDLLEVYTRGGVLYVVGEPGGFERRETNVKEGIVGRSALWATERASMAIFPDGLWAVRLPARESLSRGQASPWFDAAADLSAVLVGASEGIVYAADGVRLLALDWEAKEWFDLELPDAALGFLWVESQGALAVKTEADAYLLERGTDPVDFVLRGPTLGTPGFWSPLPPRLNVVKRGVLVFEVWAWFSDEEVPGTEELLAQEVLAEGDGNVVLPAERPHGWYWVLRGTGTPETHAIREVRTP